MDKITVWTITAPSNFQDIENIRVDVGLPIVKEHHFDSVESFAKWCTRFCDEKALDDYVSFSKKEAYIKWAKLCTDYARNIIKVFEQ